MMHKIMLAIALAIPFGLTACGTGGGFTGPAGAVTDEMYGFNPQQFININQGWADLNSDGKPDIIFTGGKEGSRVALHVKFNDQGQVTSVSYEADSLSAIDPDQLRAQVETAVAEANGLTVREITPTLADMADSIVKAILNSLTL